MVLGLGRVELVSGALNGLAVGGMHNLAGLGLHTCFGRNATVTDPYTSGSMVSRSSDHHANLLTPLKLLMVSANTPQERV